MAERYDPNNPAHRSLKDLIDKKRPSLSEKEKRELADELKGQQRMGVIARILGK